jgi:tetratricopeptide (TPR) repeat protein
MAVANSGGVRPSNAEVRAALNRLLASASFARSSRLTGFLRFIVTEQLSGCSTPPKEYTLGVQVFDRDPSYDPRIDPIVRVQARQLRFKLREYYETAGREDPIRIEIPKGSYVPEITYAVGIAAEEPLAGESAPPPMTELAGLDLAPPASPAPHWNARWLVAVALLIAAAVAGILIARFAFPNRRHQVRAANPAAEELYLKGKFYWNKRSPDSLNQAVDYFTQAIVRDPGYAKAYAGLADCYNLLREYSVMPPSVAWPRALAAAQKAVELDNTSAEAHASLGFALFFGTLDTVNGQRELRRAIALDPNYETAHHWYASALMAIGQEQEAYAEIQRARELNPASTSVLADEGYILYFRGQTDRAVEFLKQVAMADADFRSPHVYLARIYLFRGDWENYLVEAGKAAELANDGAALTTWAAARKSFETGGRAAMLETILERQKSLLAQGRSTHYEIAETCARLGKNREAIDQLQAAVANREMNILALGQDPALACLRGEPGFRELQNTVKRTLRI